MEVRKGYKQTDVGIIPSDWEVKRLKELTILLTNGFVGKAKTFYTESDDGVLYIQGYNVEENSFNMTGIKKVTNEFHKQHQKSNLREGDLLTIQTGEIGLTTIIPKDLEDANCHALIISRFKNSYHSKYFSYYFNSFNGRKRFRDIETGTTMKHLNVGDMENWLVPHPKTKAEQTAIAQVLSDTDELISSLEKLIEKKKLIKQGTMQQLLTGKKRLPGFSLEWKVRRLGDLADIQRGASPRPIDSPAWYSSLKNVGWVRISDVTSSNGRLLEKTEDYLSKAGIARSRFLKKGSLIMSICATVGIPVITNFDVCIHDGFVGFSNLSEVDQVFLLYKLKELENIFKTMGQMGSQSNLNTELVNNYEINLPPIDEQLAIAKFLSDIDTEIEALQDKLNKYKSIKQGMMQNLLTGKIRLV